MCVYMFSLKWKFSICSFTSCLFGLVYSEHFAIKTVSWLCRKGMKLNWDQEQQGTKSLRNDLVASLSLCLSLPLSTSAERAASPGMGTHGSFRQSREEKLPFYHRILATLTHRQQKACAQGESAHGVFSQF